MMAYPAGYSSDEDGYGGFISDEELDLGPAVRPAQLQAPPLTMEQRLNSLFFAVMQGNLAQVTSALDAGIDVNGEMKDAWTLIMLAASVGNLEIVRELINRGANVNSSREHHTPLMAACSCPEATSPASKCLDIVLLLIEKGADVDAVTLRKKNALMFAASNGNVEVVRKLLTVCNVNAEDYQGWTALFWAVSDNQPKVVELLLEAGLSLYKTDLRGHKPEHYAITRQHEEVLKVLPLQVVTTASIIEESQYRFETIFTEHLMDKRPQFFRDVCILLCGMRCEELIDRFVDTNLLEFLSMNDIELLKLGVVIPYKRHRILTGLHKFHWHPFERATLPVVPIKSVCSTIDLAYTLLSTIRHLTVMQASLRYISNVDKIPHKRLSKIKDIRDSINVLEETANRLNLLTEEWDFSNRPVDLITRRKTRTRRWLKWLAYFSIMSMTAVVATKIRKH